MLTYFIIINMCQLCSIWFTSMVLAAQEKFIVLNNALKNLIILCLSSGSVVSSTQTLSPELGCLVQNWDRFPIEVQHLHASLIKVWAHSWRQPFIALLLRCRLTLMYCKIKCQANNHRRAITHWSWSLAILVSLLLTNTK